LVSQFQFETEAINTDLLEYFAFVPCAFLFDFMDIPLQRCIGLFDRKEIYSCCQLVASWLVVSKKRNGVPTCIMKKLTA